MHIECYTPAQLDAVIRLSLRAWEPVFESIQQTMTAEIYQAFYPKQWQANQEQAVGDVCTAADTHVWVAIESDTPVGFVAVKLHPEENMGEIYMLAVDPDYQQQGIGSGLAKFALAWMKDQGLAIAMVETGGDPGHAAARSTYEKVGFSLWPVARYFKTLS